MTFKDAYNYADVVFSHNFQGNKEFVKDFTGDFAKVNITQKYGLTRPLTNSTRDLYVSKLLTNAIDEMKNIKY